MQTNWTADYVAITQQINTYFDGLYHSDVNRLQQVFHPKAHYITVSSGSLVHLTVPDYFKRVKNRVPPARLNQPRHDQIKSIELISASTAIATVNCAIAPQKFTDVLNFIYLNDRWQIISKVFHYENTL